MQSKLVLNSTFKPQGDSKCFETTIKTKWKGNTAQKGIQIQLHTGIKKPKLRHVHVAVPCDPNEGDLLAAAVVDQRHAHVLQRQDDFLFGQLSLFALTEQLVDAKLLSEEHNSLETFGSTINTYHTTR